MNRRDFQIGPGAASLLLIAVVLCMGVLGSLSLVSSRGDAKLSERSMRMTESAARLYMEAEEKLAALDALLYELAGAEDDEAYLAAIQERLPADAQLFERTLRWEEAAEDGRRVTCAVEIAPLGAYPRVQWTDHRLWTELNEDASEQLLLLPF